ncbi:MAG TPA: hypothetical protein VGU61_06325 [Noviherbaspirillum sp.]|jgi:hypothetical protein|uniref:hypothetical protein n=1 Tax=Noviherbaspirillum sp. TaxID=1926288 RepID=UPI002DDDB7C7|nr:hypothetical protein [Noviherbaspirillum sp.]HEV2609864.1 hypothetical protein [Noviherbaspirillum sp.]
MGTEYKITVPQGIDSILSLDDFRYFETFWKKDERYGTYHLGRVPNSDWSEIMVWKMDSALGVTINGGESEALHELMSFVRRIKKNHPDLEITEWDSDDDLSGRFFGS